MGGTYEAINSAEDVTNLNQGMTDQAWSMFTNAYNQNKEFMGGYDYLAPYQTFMQNIAPGLQDLVYGGKGAESMYGYAQSQADKNRGDLQQQYGGQNALFSGSFGRALGEGVSQPFQQAAAGLNQQLGSLYGNALGTMPGAYAQPYQWANNTMQTSLQGLGAMGQPNYWSPDYAYQPGPWDIFSSLWTLGGDVAKTVVSATAGAA